MEMLKILERIEALTHRDCTLVLFRALKGGELEDFLHIYNIVQEFQTVSGLKIWACPDPDLIGVYHSDHAIALELSAEELERRLKAAFEKDAELGFDKCFK